MSKGVSILLVEDNFFIRNFIQQDLKKLGFRCVSAGNELDAIKIIEGGFFPETALIDFHIPEGGTLPYLDSESYGMTGGLRLAKSILNKTGERCRIAITSGLDSYRSYAQEAGVWGFVAKPVKDSNVLYEMLKKGFLRDEEMRQPTLDINHEIRKLSWGKER